MRWPGRGERSDRGREGLALLVLLIFAGGVLLLAPDSSTREVAAATPDVERAAGGNRYETAAAISAAAFPDGADVVYVATGDDFPDALASGPVAGLRRAPILLTQSDGVPGPTAEEIVRLTPSEIFVLGGQNALSSDIAAQLEALVGSKVTRLSGPDRFATAAEVSSSYFEPGVDLVYLATGRSFPDALAGGAAGAHLDAPVLLTDTEALPDATQAELERLTPGRIVVLGGATQVSDAVLDAVRPLTEGDVTRVSGTNRYATSAAVADGAFEAQAVDTVYLATGSGFADALAGVPAAAAAGAPVLLVADTCLPGEAMDALRQLSPRRVVLLGGEGVLSPYLDHLYRCGLERTVIAQGFSEPSDVVFTPDGRAWIAERATGRVVVRDDDGNQRVDRTLAVSSEGEQGLLGLAVSPTWEADGLLFAYLSTPAGNEVVRFAEGEEPVTIVSGIPTGAERNGGRLAFTSDGLLLVATGDAGRDDAGQDGASMAGKLLRVNPDGSVPEGNPFPGSPVWALGFRDPGSLAFSPDSRLFVTDKGPTLDELNSVGPGGNYGWPAVEGIGRQPGLTDPIATRSRSTASWSGATLVQDSAVPEWDDDLVISALAGERLYRYELQGAGVREEEEYLRGAYGGVRGIRQAPDGSLWVLTNAIAGDQTPNDPEVAEEAGDKIVRLGPVSD